jgi:MFS family permease
LFLILSVVVDLESGIFNSSVDILQKDLEMNNAQYGLFVSISFTGRIIGLVIFMVLLNFKHRKFTLITTIFLHGSSYGLYQISNNSYILIFAKMFAAGNKVCATIYRPVWIEQFGLSNYKSFFFALVQIMSSYGQIIGFNLGSFLFQENWKFGLLSVLVIMYIIAVGFLICPGKYFKRNYMYYEDKLVDTDDDEENKLGRESLNTNNNGDNNTEPNNNENAEKNIIEEEKKSNINNKNKKKRGTVFVDAKKVERKSATKKGKKI